MKKPIITFIMATSRNGIIGNENKLLWNVPSDLKLFKGLTKGKTVVMGRKTYESIGRPLPDRNNLIISTKTDKIDGCLVFNSIENTIDYATNELKVDELIILGGLSVYNQFLPYLDRLYISVIDCIVEGDTKMPSINFKKGKLLSYKFIEKGENDDYGFEFYEWKF